MNPKVVSCDELYGVNKSDGEWQDGLLSHTMRKLGSNSETNPTWMIFDGDLDANWIESMNTVMDDNKVLTLASNERIHLKSNMRVIFELENLLYATPATVSRNGCVFVDNSKGSQLKSYFKTWLAGLN